MRSTVKNDFFLHLPQPPLLSNIVNNNISLLHGTLNAASRKAAARGCRTSVEDICR